MEVDTVIPSIGTGANTLLAQTTPDMQFTKRGYIAVESEATGRTTNRQPSSGDELKKTSLYRGALRIVSFIEGLRVVRGILRRGETPTSGSGQLRWFGPRGCSC
jgi:hypothetical protein